ncbi:RAMP superfamily CRISPR-associated protein [Limnoraphis robusta]|uniref:RAMP superfamily CRISPR-associated protein n=1 Tax=Limnoraphis robusta CCNP1315 TaxID=3110306 RepID=A0ABU5TVS6_9CYAN|nr:RAMP superfamily CRISPR-associated protein [Limnoraphis robusta]MEA5519002.1 RAMP superfamily CRISPR-associated protein [Limnoraphis robusta CCNP1315]MEA5544026.1 RAMP superfamily CRISPR-associated protein [Limnoraphis robusta CCNP1324]
MKALTFLLHTQQPILATSLQGDPNSDVSYPYIPGSMIRGVLIGRYLNHLTKHHGLQETDDILDSQRFPDVTRLFFDEEKTRYLNAYPVDIKQNRTLPVPRSWYKDKNVEFSETKDEIVYDFSKISVDERDEGLSPKLLNEEFCTVEDQDVLLYRVKRRINIHNQRDRKRGKGIEGSGAVFRYDAIDAKQTFKAVVLCDSQDDKDIIELLLQPKDIWLGGSQSAGYGHVTVELVTKNDEWDEVGITTKERIERNKYLTITLLSDTIVRNECGQVVADPDVLRHLLSKLLAVDIQFKKIKYENESGEEKEIEDGIYASSTIVGGFNRKWGLPLPQTPAFAAGSVFIFNQVDLDLQKVKTLEEQGIGERRVDGFGRIIVNWLDDEHTEYTTRLPQPQSKSGNTSEALAPESLKVAKNIAARIVRKNLDELLLKQVSNIKFFNKDKISNSQLSRLMIVTLKALSELEIEQEKPENERKTIAELAEPIHELLRNLPSNARNQFESIRLSTEERLDKQIQAWINYPDSWLNNSWRSDTKTKNLVDSSGTPTVNIAGVPQGFDNYVALEYSLRLIMAIAKKTMKEKNND